jgi:hypothetical protein
VPVWLEDDVPVWLGMPVDVRVGVLGLEGDSERLVVGAPLADPLLETVDVDDGGAVAVLEAGAVTLAVTVGETNDVGAPLLDFVLDAVAVTKPVREAVDVAEWSHIVIVADREAATVAAVDDALAVVVATSDSHVELDGCEVGKCDREGTEVPDGVGVFDAVAVIVAVEGVEDAEAEGVNEQGGAGLQLVGALHTPVELPPAL